MKHYIFIYTEDRDYLCDPSFGSYNGRDRLFQRSFPAGTSDREIAEPARSLELKAFLEDYNTGSESLTTRSLVRIVMVARDLPLDP